MARLLLVHGSWRSSECWHETAQALRNAGHHVMAPDLPGQGADATPAPEVSLEVAERRLERVARLVCVTETGHAPFFDQPDALGARIEEAARP